MYDFNYIFEKMHGNLHYPHPDPLKKNTKYVADGLKDDPHAKWVGSGNCECPIIVISAPTGSGKSTFVLNELRQIAKNSKQSVLFLTNRNIQNLQQKILASRITSNEKFGAEVIDDVCVYDNLWIYTYQSALQKLDSNRPKNAGFIVFDEAHFFLSDSSFNSETDIIWFQLLYMFPDAQRIYMSATAKGLPQLIDIVEYKVNQRIKDIVDNVNCNYNIRFDGYDQIQHMLSKRSVSEIVEYIFPENFSNVKIQFYNSKECLNTLIDPDGDDKWLIFVSSKEDGDDLRKSLNSKVKDIKYIDADTKSENKAFISNMALQEMFDCRVLICTSVLDCGVNFKDPELKNIVIDSPDELQIKQMLGRKRREKNETVNLYIKQKTKEDIARLNNTARHDYKTLNRIYQDTWEYFESEWGKIEPRVQRLLRVPIQIGCHRSAVGLSSLSTTNQPLGNRYDEFRDYYVYENDSNNVTYYNPHIPFICYNYGRYLIYEQDRYFNNLLPYYFSIIMGKYENLLGRFAKQGDTAFMREVCEWLGTTFPEDMVVDEHLSERDIVAAKEKAKEDLLNFIRQYLDNVGSELSKSEVIELRDSLRKILQDLKLTGGPKSGKTYLKGDDDNAKKDTNIILDDYDLPFILRGRAYRFWLEEKNNQEHKG